MKVLVEVFISGDHSAHTDTESDRCRESESDAGQESGKFLAELTPIWSIG